MNRNQRQSFFACLACSALACTVRNDGARVDAGSVDSGIVDGGVTASGDGGGTDAGGFDGGAPIDAGDAGPASSWEPCCDGGVLSTCYCSDNSGGSCPSALDCENGVCVHFFSTDPRVLSCPADAGIVSDAGRPPAVRGNWEICCINGIQRGCYCRSNASCEFGAWLVNCGGNTCAYTTWDIAMDGGTPCPPDGGIADAG